MICARCEDGDHKDCTDGESRELGGTILCDCASHNHSDQRFEGVKSPECRCMGFFKMNCQIHNR